MIDYCVEVILKSEEEPIYFYYDESYSKYISQLKEKLNNEIQTYVNPQAFFRTCETCDYIEESAAKEIVIEEALSSKVGKIIKRKKFCF